MHEFLQNGGIVSLEFAGLALLLWWAMLRLLDIISGQRFKHDVLPIIRKDARACAWYFGLRCLAAAIVVGLVLSSVRL